MYKAFVSYRKSLSATSANLVKQTLTECGNFNKDEIFLDRHNIGPEYFDTKLVSAIKDSACLILIVNPGCFEPKTGEDEKDWYIEEIKQALAEKITIIPMLFGGIKTLSEAETKASLKKSFSDEEIKALCKAQCVRYDDDYSEPALERLIDFVNQAYKKWLDAHRNMKVREAFKDISISVGVCVVLLALFVGICFCLGIGVGYLKYDDSVESIMKSNTKIDNQTLHFSFRGLEATYDLEKDIINVDIPDSIPEIEDLPFSLSESVLSACTFSGALELSKQSVKYIKYVRYIKSGSKPAKIAKVVMIAAACAGSFVGISQGMKLAKEKIQAEKVKKLFPKLKDRESWRAAVKDNPFLELKITEHKLASLKALNDYYNAVWIHPIGSTSTAYLKGLHDDRLLLSFNDWSFGGDFSCLDDVVKNSVDKQRELVLVDTVTMKVSRFSFEPDGMMGISYKNWHVSSELESKLLEVVSTLQEPQ